MTDGVNVRELALGVLLSVTRDGEYSHIALKATLEFAQSFGAVSMSCNIWMRFRRGQPSMKR